MIKHFFMISSDKLIDKINQKNIKPIPKWVFKAKYILLWIFYICFISFGAISISLILFSVQQSDFNLLSHIGHGQIEMILTLIPYIWLILLLLLICGSVYAIYNSKKGYKFQITKLIAYNIGLSIVLGILFFLSGGGDILEKTFTSKMGIWESIEDKKSKIWNNPDEGTLSGKIITYDSLKWSISGLDQKKWEVDIRSAFIANSVLIEKGEKVKMIGEITNNKTFKAKEIYPWGGRGHMMRMHKFK